MRQTGGWVKLENMNNSNLLDVSPASSGCMRPSATKKGQAWLSLPRHPLSCCRDFWAMAIVLSIVNGNCHCSESRNTWTIQVLTNRCLVKVAWWYSLGTSSFPFLFSITGYDRFHMISYANTNTANARECLVISHNKRYSIFHIRWIAYWAIELQYSRRVRTGAPSICNRDWVYTAEGVISES